MQKQTEDVGLIRDRLDKDIAEQMDKIQRASKSLQSKLNNVRAVKGQGFENSRENIEILTEVEALKNKHLLGTIQ